MEIYRWATTVTNRCQSEGRSKLNSSHLILRRTGLYLTKEFVWVEITSSDGFNLLKVDLYYAPDTTADTLKLYFGYLERVLNSHNFRVIHFVLTDQCTIQSVTKLVFSVTTLKLKIWLKFLWLTLHSNMFRTWQSILRELFSVLSWNCTYLLHTKLVPVSVWQLWCSYWCVCNPSVVGETGCGCTCVDRPNCT
jgi:hypothetical protein